MVESDRDRDESEEEGLSEDDFQEDDEDVAANEEADEEFDVTASQKKKGGKKKGPKTPKKGGEEDAGAKRPPRKRRKKNDGSPAKAAEDKEPDTEGEATLFDIVKKNKSAIPSTVQEWVRSYTAKPTEAMVTLINFIFQSCGSPANAISQSDFEENKEDEIDEIIKRYTEKYEQEGGEYPIVAKGKMRKFRDNYAEFWRRLIEECQAKILYDETFIPALFSWLIPISNSKARPFRHTATVTGLSIVGGLIGVASKVTQELEIVQHQHEVAGKGSKSPHKKGRLADDLHDRLVALEQYMGEIFNGMFVHRYRDILPEIRASCLTALGSWIDRHPTNFLSDSYVKYLGWMLNDRSPEVRLASLSALEKLYQKEEHFTHLQAFSERFKKRICQMANDKDPAVGVVAIHTCTLLTRYDVLDDEDIDAIYKRISDENAFIRNAAAEFVHAQLFDREIREQVLQARSVKGDERVDLPTYQLKGLLSFILDKTDHAENPLYIVDALWGKLGSLLKSWSTMTDLLLSEDDPLGLSDAEETLLVRVMVGCVRKAVGENIVPKTRQEHSIDHKERKDAAKKNAANITNHFASVLPRILKKFQADEDKLEELATVPLYYDLETYATTRQAAAHHGKLLSRLRELYPRLIKPATLDSVARTLHRLTDPEFAMNADTQQAVHKLREILDQRVRELMMKLIEEPESQDSGASQKTASKGAKKTTTSKKQKSKKGSDEEEEEEEEPSAEDEDIFYSFAVTLRRLDRLYRRFNLSADMEAVKTNIGTLLTHNASNSEAIVLPAISILYQHLLWKLSMMTGEGLTSVDFRGTEELRDEVIGQLQALIDKGATFRIRRRAFVRLLDILLVFNAHLSSAVSSLIYRPRQALIDKLTQNFDLIMDEFEQIERGDLLEEEPGDAEGVVDPDGYNSLSEEKSAIFGAMVKVILYGPLPVTTAPVVLRHFVRHGKTVGDIPKYFLVKLRDKVPELEWDLIFNALKLQYQRVIESSEKEGMTPSQASQLADEEEAEKKKKAKGDDDKEEDEEEKAKQREKSKKLDKSAALREYREFTDLASRLAMSYGVQQKGLLRTSLVRLIDQGITFGLEDAPRNFTFLGSGLSPFVSKLDARVCDRLVSLLASRVAESGYQPRHDRRDDDGYFQFEDQLRRHSKKGGVTLAPAAEREGEKSDAEIEAPPSTKGKGGRKKKKGEVDPRRKLDFRVVGSEADKSAKTVPAAAATGNEEEIEEASDESPSKQSRKRKREEPPAAKSDSDEEEEEEEEAPLARPKKAESAPKVGVSRLYADEDAETEPPEEEDDVLKTAIPGKSKPQKETEEAEEEDKDTSPPPKKKPKRK